MTANIPEVVEKIEVPTGTFSILMTEAVKEQKAKLPTEAVNKIRNLLKRIAEDPYSDFGSLGLNVRKMVEPEWLGTFRLRTGQYRCLFEIQYDNQKILVLWIGTKQNAPYG